MKKVSAVWIVEALCGPASGKNGLWVPLWSFASEGIPVVNLAKKDAVTSMNRFNAHPFFTEQLFARGQYTHLRVARFIRADV